MQRQRILVDLYDDLDQARNVDTPADQTVRLGFNDVVVELDLTNEHGTALADFLAPYMRAGRRLRGRVPQSQQRNESGWRSVKHPGGVSAARRRNKRIQQWGLTQPEPLRSMTQKWVDGGHHSQLLDRAYNAAHPEDAI